jgi:hypothetical protein
MTAVSAPGGTSLAGGSSGSGGRSRAYLAIGVVAAIVVAVILLALIAPTHRTDGPPLDPTSTSATGTKAAVELARRLGADVSITSQLPDARTDVAVLFEDLISEDQTADVLAWVSAGHTLVVADPYSTLTPLANVGAAGPIGDQAYVDRGRCDVVDPAGLTELGRLAANDAYGTFDPSPGETACFADGSGALLVVEPIGAGRLVSLGSAQFFTNELLDQADNAGLWSALAVPAPGTHLDVLVAGVDGSGLQPSDSGDLTLPTGVVLGLLQLLVAFIVYSLYRARRLGKPVSEDLPVVIAGSELTRAVGGLLEHAGARDRAASSLRRSARRRLSNAFGLPAGTDPPAVVATIADRTSIDRSRLEGTLLDAPVADDGALATLARDLDDIVELSLGRPSGPGTPAGAAPPPPPAPPALPSPPTAPPGVPS